MATLLQNDDKQVVLLAQDALAAFNGNITDVVAGVIQGATNAGKIAALELLSMRRADSCADKVLEQIEFGSPGVRNVAYKALKDVVVARHFRQLCDMLEIADASVVPELQDAIVSSIGFMPEKQQVRSVKERMSEAGKAKMYLYYPVLAATTDKEALDLIVEGFLTGSEQAKKAAFEALLSWKTMDVAEILFDICKKRAEQGTLFDEAIGRYINLVGQSDMTSESRLPLLRNAMKISRESAQREFDLEIYRDVERMRLSYMLVGSG